MAISRVTHGLIHLSEPPNTPLGAVWRYGFGVPLQVGPSQAVIFANIHRKLARTFDFEMGTDAIVFDDLRTLSPQHAVPVSRNVHELNPNTGVTAEMVKYTTVGGFVPLGAEDPDGAPHPHAGTGFVGDFAYAHPIDDGDQSRPYPGVYQGEQEHAFWEFHQCAYDGAGFRVTRTDRFSSDLTVSGYTLFSGPLFGAIIDGEDLLLGFGAFRPERSGRGFASDRGVVSGVTRWERGSEGWRPVSFQPVTGPIDAIEPSLIRDTDGSLLFSARPSVSDEQHRHSVLVWRSVDQGTTWQKVLDIPHLRQASPVTLNQDSDGNPYLLCNQALCAFVAPHWEKMIIEGHEHGGFREIVCLWPLDEARTGLLSPLIVRFPRYEFGVPADGRDWTADHPNGRNVRLKDGRMHSLICYRLLAQGEITGCLPPAPASGLWVEELLSE